MTKDEALKMCLEYIETDAHERKYVRHAIKEVLAQPEQESQVVRNETLEEVAKEFDKMPFGDTSASFARFVRDMKK